jgi:hypothetical protein
MFNSKRTDPEPEALPMQDGTKARIKRLAPFFVIGPISGPLLAGVVFNFRGGRPVLAVLYLIALIEVAIWLPAVVAKATVALTL